MLEQIESLRRRVVGAFAEPVRPCGMEWVRLYEGSPDEWYTTPSQKQLTEQAERMEAYACEGLWTRDILRESVKDFRSLSPPGKVFILAKVLPFALDDASNVAVHPNSLDSPRRKTHLLEDFVWGLRPTPWAVHWCGGDPAHEELCDLLTEEQFRCVTNLLGLVRSIAVSPDVDELWNGGASAWRALNLGWSRYQTPEGDAMMANRQDLLNYEWPPAQDPEIRQLISQIHVAFAHVQYPGDKYLTNCRCSECSEHAHDMRGSTDWRKLGPNASIDFPTLTNDAKRWFMPAAMVCDLMSGRRRDVAWHCTLWLYSEEETGDAQWIVPKMFERRKMPWDRERKSWKRKKSDPQRERKWAEQRFLDYSRAQAECVITFLERDLRHRLVEARRELQGPFLQEGPFRRVRELREALESYWIPSLEWRG